MQHQDVMTDRTVAQICAAEPFRGARVAEVVPLHQRSLCCLLHFDDGRSVFVKRALPSATSAFDDPVAHEVAVLARLRDLAVPAPRLLLTLGNPDSPVLVTDDVSGSGSLEDCRQESGGTNTAWAAAAGRALAAVHAAPVPDGLPATDPASRLARAWTVVTPRDVTRYAGGYAEALRQLRRDGLVPLVERTAAEWTPTTLVHGDVKSDNVLCGADPDGPAPLTLVDWETGGLGDPRWDVGCLIGDSLYTWLSGIDLDAGPDLDDWIAAADPPFSAVQADIGAMARAYASLRPVSAADRRLWVRFAAFFLLQRLCSAAVHTQVLPTRSLAFLQVAAQLLRRPDECGELLCP